MDWEIINILVKAPRKKYVKKLLEYSVAISHCYEAVPKRGVTPISQQFYSDLQLTSEESHRLIKGLIKLIGKCENFDFENDKMRQWMDGNLDEQLVEILVELIIKMSEDIKIHSNILVSQAQRLVGFDWQLDVEVATDKGTTNTPIVQLELTTAKDSKLVNNRVTMRGPQFEVFFGNLSKIKEQLGRLVSEG